MSYARFPTTQWSILDAASDGGMNGHALVLDQLLRRYLPALKLHLVVDRGLESEAADDLLQEFVLSKILQHGILSQADPSRGRFRTFLLTVLDRFLIDHRRRTKVRLGRISSGQNEEDALEVRDHHPVPNRAFDLAWAKAVVAQAIEAARAQFIASGREDLWRVLQSRVLDPILQNTPPPPYEQMVREFGYKTASQACSAVLTARRALARIMREVVAQYVPQETVEEELRLLQQILSDEHAG